MLDLHMSKTGVLRKHIAFVVSLHAANAIALWATYRSDDFPGRETFIAFFSLVIAEGKVPTWFSGATLLACGLLLALISAAKYRDRDAYRLYWLMLSATFFYISFDEMTTVHEGVGPALGEVLGVNSVALGGWVVPGLIALSAFGLTFVRFVLHLPSRSRVLFVIAGSTYVLGALGLEIVGRVYLATSPDDLTYGIIATVEEVLEMGGIVIFVYALLDYLENHAAQEVSIKLS